MTHRQVEKSIAEKAGLFTPKVEITGRVKRVVTVTASEDRTYFALFVDDRVEPYRVYANGIEKQEAVAIMEAGATVKLTVKADLAEFESRKSYFQVVSGPEIISSASLKGKDERFL
ncbi:hypothetical protein [Paraburkholderia humisilvae]|uniref:Uncharacterized protein n=1 Tax=Paraburkholderia humisilvae TaxID=627669 RepID=A0A6J5DNF3_9BURK|nr:hypothetical protein [Paraburkholderia humisilvae]CAB3754326.1 hypothetical protein LMG29542_02316 [Paraburkholderia humisilvae]